MVVYFVTDLALPLAVIKGILKLILVIFLYLMKTCNWFNDYE